MIVHVPPGSPALLRDAADAILALHIGGGLGGVVSGAAALLVRKGGLLHRAAGHLFFVSMLVMAGIGTLTSPFLPDWSNVMMGLFIIYLVTTAWMTVRRPAGRIGRFEVAALLFAWAITATGGLLALWAAASPGGRLAGDPPFVFLVQGSFPALASVLDLKVIESGGLTGASRVTRHLWRMGVAQFVATASLFLGQQKLFPQALHGSPVMFIPEIAVVALLVLGAIRQRPPRRGTPRTKQGYGSEPNGGLSLTTGP